MLQIKLPLPSLVAWADPDVAGEFPLSACAAQRQATPARIKRNQIVLMARWLPSDHWVSGRVAHPLTLISVCLSSPRLRVPHPCAVCKGGNHGPIPLGIEDVVEVCDHRRETISSVRSIVPALAQAARAGHPQFEKGKEKQRGCSGPPATINPTDWKRLRSFPRFLPVSRTSSTSPVGISFGKRSRACCPSFI